MSGGHDKIKVAFDGLKANGLLNYLRILNVARDEKTY
jgi:hypothetical protein